MPWPWDTALASLALAPVLSPGREAGEDQDCLKRMANPWMGQHSWKPGRPSERSDMNTQTQKAARSAGQQRLFQLWEVFTFHFGQNLRNGNTQKWVP